MKPRPDPDLAQWCTALASSAPTADVVPPGWLTCAAIAKKLGKSESHTSKLLRHSISQGRCERKTFRVPTGGRGAFPLPHYRPLP